ncbi:helix-turn-helix domain-containing protein [Actinophytocola glycyrrhizae]|uniref:LysR family transcriptional regulator n=1 Tax=Actinophytocola glycyrrhizae TaxID=2044873 RepID=A0ABV9S1P6_9PSEU
MDLEVRHFRLVEAIAQAGSITKAASAPGVSQPFLTAQLQRIERRVGGPLFRRDRTGSQPDRVWRHGRWPGTRCALGT